MAHLDVELIDKLARRKLPLGSGSEGYAAYVWRCATRWIINAAEEAARSLDIPEDYAPPSRAWGQPDELEHNVFADELMAIAPQRILADCRLGSAFQEAARYVLSKLCVGEEPPLLEVRRRWRRGDPRFVVSWCRMRLRVLLEPVRELLVRREHDLRMLYS